MDGVSERSLFVCMQRYQTNAASHKGNKSFYAKNISSSGNVQPLHTFGIGAFVTPRIG